MLYAYPDTLVRLSEFPIVKGVLREFMYVKRYKSPGAPDEPEEPDVPDVPDVPEEPDVPDVPDVPEVPL
jgi:hypothetical protein